jgi:hypothetical protein
MKKVSEAIIYIFCPSFYWYFLKNENSIFLKKNGHFFIKKLKIKKKESIFMKKNAIFIFKKNTNKKKGKKYILLLQILFSFFTLLFLKKIKKVKVGQKLGKKVGPLTFSYIYIYIYIYIWKMIKA